MFEIDGQTDDRAAILNLMEQLIDNLSAIGLSSLADRVAKHLAIIAEHKQQHRTKQNLPATATGEFLNAWASLKDITREDGETDDSLRARTLAAYA